MLRLGDIKNRITPIARKYRLKAVFLFGSYARGNATEDSDIDILIDRTDSDIKTAFDLGGLYEDLKEALDSDIDLVTTNTLDQSSTRERTPDFVRNVYQERILLWHLKTS